VDDRLVGLVVAGLGHQDRPERPHPGHLLVAGVPDQPDDATRPQHAAHLRGGRLRLEPVRGLPGHHRVDAAVGQGDLLRPAGQRLDVRVPRLQLGEHLLGRVDRHHLVPRRQHDAGQQARSGAQVEDPQRPVAEQEPDGIGRVARPQCRVARRDRAERASPLVPGPRVEVAGRHGDLSRRGRRRCRR
jgi:hypothetical protein